MKFAINYSPQAAQLLQTGQIAVDLFKCPPWHDLVAQAKQHCPVYVHFDWIAGRGLLADADLDALADWLEATDTPCINTHLAALRSDFPAGAAVSPDAVIEQAVRDIEVLGQRFGNARVIVENVPYPEGSQRSLLAEVVDPQVISEVVQRTGCGFLLDLAHAVRACEGTGRHDVKAYLNALPVAALRELHVVGILPAADERGVRHDHFELTAADWTLTEWAVAQIRAGRWGAPGVMAFEYGGVGPLFERRSKPAVIAAQAPRLQRLAASV